MRHIDPTDFVLEIGSGHDPKTRSDVLCDKFIDDDIQRGGKIVTDRPIVAADGQYLPFADKSFDYIICSHVLEHAENPELLLNELMRVGYRGYIETPTEIAERLYGWPYHNWIVNLVEGKLLIQKKVCDNQFGQLFHCLATHDKDFARFHSRYHQLFLVQYEWNRKIDYEILPPDPSPLDLGSVETAESMIHQALRESLVNSLKAKIKNSLPQGIKTKIKSMIVKQKKSPKRELHKIVVCPVCKGEVEWLEKEILCRRCDISYPIRNGIPYLLIQSG